MRHLTGDRFGVWSGALINDGIGDVVFFDRSRPEARIRSDLSHEVAHVEAEHVLSGVYPSLIPHPPRIRLGWKKPGSKRRVCRGPHE